MLRFLSASDRACETMVANLLPPFLCVFLRYSTASLTAISNEEFLFAACAEPLLTSASVNLSSVSFL